MQNSSDFKHRLSRRPLIFTAIPLRDSKTGDTVHDKRILENLSTRIEELGNALSNVKRLNAVSVPELVEENHEGKPRYNSIYTRMLARGTSDKLGKDAIVNKVVAHIETYEKFVEWIRETSSLGISNLVFVGGNTRHHRYPGPSVSEANLIAGRLWNQFNRGEITIGNISLPERGDEAKRMLFKTIAGAEFFTTQMLFDSERIAQLISDYGHLCEVAGLKPATVILGFAPLKGVADLNLLDFLGVDLPDSAKDYILDSGEPSGTSRRSILNSLRIYHRVLSVLEDQGIGVPIGVNVEQLTKSNFSSSISMLEEFEKAIDLKPVSLQKRINSIRPD